jgi:hypothetical protein
MIDRLNAISGVISGRAAGKVVAIIETPSMNTLKMTYIDEKICPNGRALRSIMNRAFYPEKPLTVAAST